MALPSPSTQRSRVGFVVVRLLVKALTAIPLFVNASSASPVFAELPTPDPESAIPIRPVPLSVVAKIAAPVLLSPQMPMDRDPR